MKSSLLKVMQRATALTGQRKLADAAATLQSVLKSVPLPGVPRPRVQVPPMAPSLVAALASLSASTIVPKAREEAVHAGSFLDGDYANATMSRAYKLFVPTAVEPRPALVLMLHGCTQDPDDFARGTRVNAHAEQDGFLVLYPAQTTRANASRCWNWFGEHDQTRGKGEVAYLADLTKHVADTHDVDPSRIYVAGLSAGGAMAAILAAEYPELFAAACVHSGLAAGSATSIPEALAAMRSGSKVNPGGRGPARVVPTIVIHGTSDRTVHPSNADAIVASIVRDVDGSNATVTEATRAGRRSTRTVHADDNGSTLVELWALHSAGHAWSGGSAEGSHTDPQGIDATAEMLRFFKEQGGTRH